MMEVVQTHIIPERDRIDEDVLRGMTSLGCFKDKDKLVEELLKPSHNTGQFVAVVTNYSLIFSSKAIAKMFVFNFRKSNILFATRSKEKKTML